MPRVTIALLLGSLAMVRAQPAPAPAGAIEPGNLIHATAGLETTAAFYRALGLDASPRLSAADALARLAGPGVRIRALTFAIPGESFGLELVEFAGGTGRSTPEARSAARLEDVGAARLVLSVRNLEQALAAAQGHGAEIVSMGGGVVPFPGANGTTRAVAVRDPDGFPIELVQFDPLPASTAPPGGNVIGGRIALSVADVDATAAFYRDVLGFDVAPATRLAPNANVMKLFGIAGTQWRYAMAKVPGWSAQWELSEFADAGAARFGPGIRDPGAPAFSVVAGDPAAVAERARSRGAEIPAPGGNAPGGSFFVRDGNGMLIALLKRR